MKVLLTITEPPAEASVASELNTCQRVYPVMIESDLERVHVLVTHKGETIKSGDLASLLNLSGFMLEGRQ